MILRSFYTLPDGRPKLILGGFDTDHRSPFEERWGGWYVTGTMEHARHMGNAMLADEDHPESMITAQSLHVASLQDKFDTNVYLSPYSDFVALLVFDHQMHMTNLITRVGWEVRCALYDKASKSQLSALLRDSAEEFVDYLLFIDEAPLPGPVHGTSGFAERFAAQAPRDRHGRSLRQFDLKTRLFRYPCSYMIYSQAFDSLPAQAKDCHLSTHVGRSYQVRRREAAMPVFPSPTARPSSISCAKPSRTCQAISGQLSTSRQFESATIRSIAFLNFPLPSRNGFQSLSRTGREFGHFFPTFHTLWRREQTSAAVAEPTPRLYKT